YLLFPGAKKDYIFDIRFKKGPTLIAGINGLGKSTLITLMLRMLTGPCDIARAAQDGDLAEVEPVPLDIDAHKIFCPRVAAAATNATACLEVAFGSERASITRSLTDLKLTSWQVGQEERLPNEQEYRDEIVKLMGLGSFFDALLILRYVVF